MNQLAEFGIATVSRQTGISAHRLRAWERRHPSLLVGRTETGRRRYSEQDIFRLRTIKQLIDDGYKIGELATLSQDELSGLCSQEALEPSLDSASKAQTGNGKLRLLTCGEAIPSALINKLDNNQNVDLCARLRSFAQIAEAIENGHYDIAVLQIETLNATVLHSLRELHHSQRIESVFIVFHYGLRELVEELRGYGFKLWRAPLNTAELYQAISQLASLEEESEHEIDSSGMAPVHIFNPSQLNKLSNVSTAIDCECPKHIAELIQSLCAFESYSQQCENRDTEDAILHRRIYLQTAHARHTMEKMLQQVIEAENIQI
ncbi:MerR family transcriptional regulator [Pseudoteredinibacter isoporae]|uniref:DNA-binding transcriptional MerR regulator n=1 Tax=Pseudoteredinibacter isoporae TaxID=570281 RepID=A0A7X0JPU6_9GAMM|nr:MerR family transcriptional regulator [Pseudoteredinibacter isoporae]MBB6520092.1 DNA-binding transcriptional MerR regulator [Pseudoteredinibacter isoporae]NHO85664.1 MerR family transcriptional regulator [Pseudoteredinibacter isoporae]NIB25884.1 MerR family transcriptional regulator [Pseudoteredinibacter isoporae]